MQWESIFLLLSTNIRFNLSVSTLLTPRAREDAETKAQPNCLSSISTTYMIEMIERREYKGHTFFGIKSRDRKTVTDNRTVNERDREIERL